VAPCPGWDRASPAPRTTGTRGCPQNPAAGGVTLPAEAGLGRGPAGGGGVRAWPCRRRRGGGGALAAEAGPVLTR